MIGHLLNKSIDIEIETTSKNGIGTPKESYTLLKNTWSGVQFTGGRTATDAQGETVGIDAIFTVRYDARINYKCRIKYLGQYYKILYIEPIDRSVGLRIKTVSFVAES